VQKERALFQWMHRGTACDNRKKGTSLLINKEDSFDKEIEDEQCETEEENTSMTSEEHKLDN